MKNIKQNHIARVLMVFVFLSNISAVLFATDALRNPVTGYFIRKARNPKIDPTERIAAYDSVLSLLPDDFMTIMEISKEKVKYCNSIYRLDLGSDTWNASLLRIKTDNPRHRCMILAEASLADRRASRHRGMIEKVMEILSIEKPDSLRPFNVYAYLDLAGMFHDFDNIERSRYYMEKAQNEYQEIREKKISEKDKIRMATHLIMAKVNSHIWNNKYGSAFAELKKMNSYPLTDQMESGVLFSEALIYSLQGENEKAEAAYLQLLTEFDTDSRDIGANNYLFLLLQTHRYIEARNLISSYPEIFSRLKTSYIAPSVYKNLMELSRVEGQYDAALSYSDSLVYVNDSISAVRNALYGSGLVDQIEDMERVRIAEKNVKEKGNLLIGVSISAAVAFSIAIIALWLFLRLRRQIHQKRKLERRLGTIDASHRKEMKDTVENLESRNRELTSTTMKLAAISSGIDRIRQIASDGSQSREYMSHAIIEELKGLSLSEGVWEMFSYYFDNVNTGFYERLHDICPQLTNAERRMCAFIVMNLTNKEIASLTNRSVRTVECIKYNLRRKLKIDVPTEQFLKCINMGEGYTPELPEGQSPEDR